MCIFLAVRGKRPCFVFQTSKAVAGRNLVRDTISDLLTSVSRRRQPVLTVKGNLDCEKPLEGAVD